MFVLPAVVLAAAAAAGASAQGTWTQATGSAWGGRPRSDHTVTPFNGNLIVIGGEYYAYNYTAWRDVWVSNGTDLTTWRPLNLEPAFPAMAYHAVEVLNGTMFLTGGGVCTGPWITICLTGMYDWYNATWMSNDGVNWVQQPVAAGAPHWAERGGHTLNELNGRLILTGGVNNQQQFNDVWEMAPDGTWSQLMEHAPWDPRSFHQVVAYNGWLVLAGGGDQGGEFADVYSTPDGVTWTLVNQWAAWPARTAHAMVNFGQTLYVIAGLHNTTGVELALTDVWSSPDGGVSWSEVTNTPPWQKRSFEPAVVFNNQLVMTGGWWLNWTGVYQPVPFEYRYYTDVWTYA